MQSTGQKLTHASQPVQLSGITTAISFGFFFFRVIFAGASGIMSVGFAFFGSYATFNPLLIKFDSLYRESMLDFGVFNVKGKLIGNPSRNNNFRQSLLTGTSSHEQGSGKDRRYIRPVDIRKNGNSRTPFC